MGKNQKHLMTFLADWPGWHTYNKKDKATARAVASLHKRGLIQVNQFNQIARA